MSQTRERYFEWILVGLILIMGSLLFYQALPFLNGTLGAITLYILLRRVNLLLSNRFSPSLAPWIITIAVTIFVMIPLSILLWYLIDLVQSVNFDVQVIIKRFTDTIRYLERTTNLQIVSEKSVAFITAKGTAFVNSLMSGINNAAINLFTTILILFFLLAGGVKMEIGIAKCLPFSDTNKHTIINKVSTIVRSNAIGIPLLAMIQGAVASVGYWLCGVNNPIEFGVLTGFASMIPIVGSMLIWIPLAIVQYFEQGVASSVYVALYGGIVISQCDNVLRMFMQKRMADTHPLITIFGVIAGLPLFGFMGLIFGPLLVAMFLLFLEMFIKQYIIGTDLNLNRSSLVQTKESLNRARAFDPQIRASSKHKNKDEFAHETTIKNAQLNNRAQIKQKNKQALLKDASLSKKRTAKKALLSDIVDKPTNSLATQGVIDNNDLNDSTTNKILSSNFSKTKSDFKTSKAESKQQKREAAKLRAQEEKKADEKALQQASNHAPQREPINLAQNLYHNLNQDNINDQEPTKNMVTRAVNQAINSFDKFDDLGSNMAFGGSELFKDDFLSDNTKEQIAKKRNLSPLSASAIKYHDFIDQSPIDFASSDNNQVKKSAIKADNNKALALEQNNHGAIKSLDARSQLKNEDNQDTAHKDLAKNLDNIYANTKHKRTSSSNRNDRIGRKDKARSKNKHDLLDRHSKKASKLLSNERNHGSKLDLLKKTRTKKAHDKSKSRPDNLGYQTLRAQRPSTALSEPVIRTVVSHQYGNFDLNKSRSSGLKTQLVSMHTAKGTVMAQPPRRRPSKRRPYH